MLWTSAELHAKGDNVHFNFPVGNTDVRGAISIAGLGNVFR